MSARAAAGLLVLAMATSALAQEEPKGGMKPPPRTSPPPAFTPRVPERITGVVYVGERAPDFVLDGSQGKPVRLSRLQGYWTLLVFAPGRQPLTRLGAIESDMAELGVRPFGICGEKSRALESVAARGKLGVVLLADVTGEISALYGLYDYVTGRIRPGFVLIDRGGTVRMALLGQDLPADEISHLVHFAMVSAP